MIWFISAYLVLGLITALYSALKICVWEWTLFGLMSILIVLLSLSFWPIIWILIINDVIRYGWSSLKD